MSRFLLAVWSLESHVNPNLAVAAALRRLGHNAAFYAGPKAAAEIQSNGFEVFPFRAVSEPLASQQFAALLDDQSDARKIGRAYSDILLSQLEAQIEDLERIVTDWRPDVVISDMAMVAPFAVLADQRPCRVAVLSHVGYCMLPGPLGPVPGRALPPATTLAGRLGAGAVTAVANFVTRGVPRTVDRVREKHGLARTGLRITELHARTGLLLIPSIPELDYQRTDLPPSVEYVGSLAWPEAPAVKRSERVLAIEEGGYYRANPFLLQTAVRAFADAEWDVRLSLGRERASGVLGELPRNMRLERDTPEASVVVTTGNTESVLRALSRGIPLVVVPSLLDQTEMALRVGRFGCGAMLAEKDCTPERLASLVETVCGNGSYSRKAAEAALFITNRGGAARAAAVFERFAEIRV